MRFQYKQVFPTESLIRWYRQAKRDLPWRETRDPYRIWLSEVILQQTRVDQGLSYYYHFVERYPTVEVLADADEQEVLRSWQGLGYYSRARNLHAAAKSVVQEGQGFPSTYREILKLKGVGPYTAAAVASFAYKEVVPVIDGNVNRVTSRFLALKLPVDSSSGKQHIQELLEQAISPEEPDTFNQAIMELGALVCVPRNPDCLNCPIASGCKANTFKNQEDFPIKKGKVKVKSQWIYSFIIADDESVVLRKRGTEGIWKNMFDLPGIESDEPLDTENLHDSLPVYFRRKEAVTWKHFTSTMHLLSHRKLHVEVLKLDSNPNEISQPETLRNIPWNELDQYPKPRLTEKLLEKWRDSQG